MDTSAFRREFWRAFAGSQRNVPRDEYFDLRVAAREDLCPDVAGMMSLKKQRLLNLAYRLLPPDEAYLEVGTYQGKSLLSAMLGNPLRVTYACDNFSEFQDRNNSLAVLRSNLERYGLLDAVTFLDGDFHAIFTPERLPRPIGVYFYDGAHDEESQFDAIRLAEPFLADEALVLVDDWRLAHDSGSYAKAGTLRATRHTPAQWRLMYELPARLNGDLGLWWNGVGVLSYRRRPAALPV